MVHRFFPRYLGQIEDMGEVFGDLDNTSDCYKD